MMRTRLPQSRFPAAEDSSESWVFAYADMMSFVAILFIIYFSVSKVDGAAMDEIREKVSASFSGKKDTMKQPALMEEERREEVFSMLVSMLNIGSDLESTVEAIEKMQSDKEEMTDVEAELAVKLEALKPYLDKDDQTNKVEISIPSELLFKPGSASLNQAASKELDKIREIITKTPGLLSVEVEGHSDSTPLSGTGVYLNNWMLSAARAASVAQQLGSSEGGIDEGSRIAARGFGASAPLYPERDSSGRPIPDNMAKNRRIAIKLQVEGRAL